MYDDAVPSGEGQDLKAFDLKEESESTRGHMAQIILVGVFFLPEDLSNVRVLYLEVQLGDGIPIKTTFHGYRRGVPYWTKHYPHYLD